MDLSFAVGVELPLAEGVDEDEEGADFESHAARSTRTSNDVKSFMCAVYHDLRTDGGQSGLELDDEAVETARAGRSKHRPIAEFDV